MNNCSSDRFHSGNICTLALATWAALGARSDLVKSNFLKSTPVQPDREEASSLVCRVISIAAR
jgi:hypothetical protein